MMVLLLYILQCKFLKKGNSDRGIRVGTNYYKLINDLICEDIEDAKKRQNSMFDSLAYPFSSRIVLVGAGGLGRKVFYGLKSLGIVPLAFVDNNPSKWGSIFENIPIMNPINASKQYGDNAVFVITIWGAGSKHRFAHSRDKFVSLGCVKVIPFIPLFWKYPEIFLPFYTIGLPSELLSQKESILKCFYLWHDDNSQNEYLKQLNWRLHADFDCLPSPLPHLQYFPVDLFGIHDEEVFVDCGAFDGDSIKDLLKICPDFRGKIIAIEPDPSNVDKLNDFIGSNDQLKMSNVIVREMAVSLKKEKMRFSSTGTAASVVSDVGSIEVEADRLDDILSGYDPTYLKMDIEGAEIIALESGEHVIRKNNPIMAISAYHEPDHLWRVPLLMKEYVNQSKFFLRSHNEEGWDLVAYSIPESRLI
jgi:FkbM family methyltransferase